MNKYHFQTDEFGISDMGIHLLRSEFNYKTIDFSQIETTTIEKGRELNRWLVVLLAGFTLLAFSVYYALGMFNVINEAQVNIVYIEEIIVPLIPFMLGTYCVYTATRNGIILKLKTFEDQTDNFPLKNIEKEGRLSELTNFLSEKLNNRFNVNI